MHIASLSTLLLIMMMLSRSTAFVVRRSIIAKASTPSLTAVWSTTQKRQKHYSQATLSRVEGLDAQEEFVKLSQKLKLTPDALHVVLSKKLAATPDSNKSTEQAEFMDWLLSNVENNSNANGNSVKAVKTNNIDADIPKKELKKPKVKASAPAQDNDDQQTFATSVQFADRKDLHPASKRALTEVMGLTSMTEIQARTFEPTVAGKDVLGRARTGTGKTVAFLLPAIERLLQLTENSNNNNAGIGILIVSPTRELATQIADQAEKLTKFHSNLNVQVMYGGTNTKGDVNKLTKNLSRRGQQTILVATPGRLLDHLQSNTKIGNGISFGRDIMSQTSLVVLDETDRLLDMGFRREISKILGYMPPAHKRQTLLFSATIPPDLKTIMAQNLKKDFVEVDCINDGDAATHTNARVLQSHVIIPSSSSSSSDEEGRFLSSVVEVVRTAVEQDSESKVVVFLPTSRMVNFFAEVFNQVSIFPKSMPVWELHSKKSQSYRNRVSEDFRNAKKGVLFTSDVSARGVDYPNVSHVIQFGLPESREQYIHRLGRTGRAGTAGKGWLVLSDWESPFLRELKGVNIPVDEDLLELLASPISDESKELVQEVQRRVRGGDAILSKSASGAYQAFLGYYLGQMKRTTMNRKEDLVDVANEFAALSGLHETPSLTKQLVGKMGLKGVSGIRISGGDNNEPSGRGGGSGNYRKSNHHQEHHDGRHAPPKRNPRRGRN